MRMMISGATTTMEQFVRDPALVSYLGGMVTPATGNSLARVCSFGVPYCLDNSSFAGNKQGFAPASFVALMQKAADAPRKPVFACVPDVVHLTPEGPVDFVPVDAVARQAVHIGLRTESDGIYHLTGDAIPTIGSVIRDASLLVGFGEP